MAFDRSKFIVRFISEAREHITSLGEGFLLLEKNPQDETTLNSVFRSAHTIKGSSRMMKFIAVSKVAHNLEDALDALRQKKIKASVQLFDLFIKTVEALGLMLDQIAAGKEVGEAPSELCEELENAAQGILVLESPKIEKQESEAKIKIGETVKISAPKLDELIKLMGEIVSGYNRSQGWAEKIYAVEGLAKQHNHLIANMEDLESSADMEIEDVLQSSAFLYHQLKKITSSFREELNIQRVLLNDLQDRSLKMRMLPLSTIFDTFRMDVRNLARSFEKEIDFVIEGGETELDKKIIEKIGESLLHIIRNSIDHGIETPAERRKAGKATHGIIRLTAHYEGGHVEIELRDDGGGIDLEKLKSKAVKKNIVTQSELDNILESEIINLVFHPGLSSSEIITDISGRGVGMDVVKQNIINELKGNIQISTQAGQGTSIIIRLPLTMAIINVLLIQAAQKVFAVPSANIEEIIRLPPSALINIVDQKAFRLREQIIPITYLHDILENGHNSTEIKQDLLIVVASAGNDRIGLIIDALLNEEDAVIKLLPQHLQKIPFVSGCIISGNNKIINVLQISKIIETAKKSCIQSKVKRVKHTKEINILVVDDSISTREIEKSILESYGYKVSLAADGLEGLARLKEFQYDLIITDVEMPQMDGFTLTQTLRKDKAYQHVPVILVTSLDRDADKKRGIQVGADAYIVKGAFEQSNLLDAVQNLVGK